MTGMTAYFALLDTGAPKTGDTVVISGAAGAVGSIAGQIAKLKGCRVVGIAGGAEKCKFLVDELGFDAAIDYKNEDVLDAVLSRLALKARVVICGAISQYNNKEAVKGPANYLSLLVNRARMEGFVVMDHAANFAAAGQEMAGWMAQGKLKSKEDIVGGLETFPETLMKLFNGENFGKLVLKVS
jgi:NADPH-dependent curcumin reductase CurA